MKLENILAQNIEENRKKLQARNHQKDMAIYYINGKAYKVIEDSTHFEFIGINEYHVIDEEFNTVYIYNLVEVMPTYYEVKDVINSLEHKG